MLRKLGNNQTVLTVNGVEVLYSYETPVAVFVSGEGYKITNEFYSKTTSRHINAWTGTKASVTKVDQSVINAYVNGSK